MIKSAKRCYFFDSINALLGFGELTTSLVIAELKDINRFDNIKQLTAYCGLDPSIKQSGSSIKGRGHISKAGNSHVRRILFNTVCNIIMNSKNYPENEIILYYRKKRNEGKHHYVAVIACISKLLRRILAECKKLQINM